jgi:hypothetical protein
LRTPKIFEDKIIDLVRDINDIKISKIIIKNGSYKLIKEKYTA